MMIAQNHGEITMNRPKLGMAANRAGLACALGTALLAGCANSGNAPAAASPVLGSYIGSIVSGGGPTPSETTFFALPNGQLAGTYRLGSLPNGRQLSQPDYGQLSACTLSPEREMRCEWRDRFGTGTFQARFNSDFSQFSGQWGDSVLESRLTWDGQRVR